MPDGGQLRELSTARLAAGVLRRMRARATEEATPRYVVGIVGPPASGKSTLAWAVRDEINILRGTIVAEVAPMDGFHLTNVELEQRGALARKGQPDTFDAEGYAKALHAVRRGEYVAWPTYDRKRHDPVPDGVIFDQSIGIVVSEGNYLLLDDHGWSGVGECFHEAWYLEVSIADIEFRLMERHIAGGKSTEEARRKVHSSDLPNAHLIQTTRERADMILRGDGDHYSVFVNHLGEDAERGSS